MNGSSRVLLVEHLDAVGSAAVDARPHAAALRAAGLAVEAVVLEVDRGGELLFDSADRAAGPGFDRLAHDPLSALAARVRASRAGLVVWAGAQPGGGAAARALPAGMPAVWWPTGHAPAGATHGPLPALAHDWAPCDGSVIAADAPARRRLSLWDGPFALLPALPAARAAAEIIAAFAQVVDGGDEVDLVVFAQPDGAFEARAREAGVGQRVHFVGRAPREAEIAWLGTAVVALVGGDSPLSGGMLLRALAAGCPLLPVGAAAAPVADWLERSGLAWPGSGLADRLAAVLDREPAVSAARDRGRSLAGAYGPAALAAKLAAALRAPGAGARRAA